ncbi:hypothetical protein OX283_011610 [Flavobacterium sp. SUN052]|uniref:hypothetical protein n=1 Tax=Flavobacterium sp. SUN052 TaxID=3002441 RepID=UPI00237EACE5|nr:hypothetical protein [Flavobacterium sp. SUN052]MEC4005304.1 hypothetical protein [Flavobacterium sp. SUN052]
MLLVNILKKIVPKFGGLDVSESNHVDTYTENKMIQVKGEQIAASENGGIWVTFQELSEYKFMNITVIGLEKFKTYEGCELIFTNENDILVLKSDTKEIESDFSNVSNRWITSISFDITNLNIDEIKNKTAKSVKLSFLKNHESFTILTK